MKRAMWEATNKCIIFPSDSDVRKLQSSKYIGPDPIIMQKCRGGRYNTIDSVVERYCASQSFMAKEGDVDFVDTHDNNEVKLIAQWENDGAEMCVEKNVILGHVRFIKAVYGKDQ